MASPQAENGFVRIATELFNQLTMRDFSKRQRAILDFIIRLSYGCNKKIAYIPKLQHFELCGVSRRVVGNELKALRSLRVIGIDEETKSYWLNKDYEQWLNEAPSEDQTTSFALLLASNIRLGGSHQNNDDGQQIIDLVHGKGQQNVDRMVNETLTDESTKHRPFEAEIPRGSKAEGVSIDSDRQEIDSTTTTTTKGATDWDSYFEAIEQRMKVKRIDPNHTVTGNSYEAARTLFKERIPLQFVLDGIDETFASYPPKGPLNRYPNFAYCARRIEDRWTSTSAKHDASAEQRRKHGGANQGRADPLDFDEDKFWGAGGS